MDEEIEILLIYNKKCKCFFKTYGLVLVLK
jgi:hypothetical protein